MARLKALAARLGELGSRRTPTDDEVREHVDAYVADTLGRPQVGSRHLRSD